MDSYFEVNCQTTLDRNYKETSYVTCVNESGSDFESSGLGNYVEDQLGIEESSKLWNIIQETIEDCANEKLDNSVDGYFAERDIYFNKDEALDNFGTFYPADVMMNVYKMECNGFCLAYFEDTSENNIKRIIVGYKVFDTKESWLKFRQDVYSGDIGGSNFHVHYGDFTASKRANEAIVVDI